MQQIQPRVHADDSKLIMDVWLNMKEGVPLKGTNEALGWHLFEIVSDEGR